VFASLRALFSFSVGIYVKVLLSISEICISTEVVSCEYIGKNTAVVELHKYLTTRNRKHQSK